jgi:hypothetical protein
LSVGPEITTEGLEIEAGAMAVPASSTRSNVIAIFSPGSKVPSSSFVPASTRPVTFRLTPVSKFGSSSGCRCASNTASGLPLGEWHSLQLALFAWAPMVCPLEV